MPWPVIGVVQRQTRYHQQHGQKVEDTTSDVDPLEDSRLAQLDQGRLPKEHVTVVHGHRHLEQQREEYEGDRAVQPRVESVPEGRQICFRIVNVHLTIPVMIREIVTPKPVTPLLPMTLQLFWHRAPVTVPVMTGTVSVTVPVVVPVVLGVVAVPAVVVPVTDEDDGAVVELVDSRRLDCLSSHDADHHEGDKESAAHCHIGETIIT